MCSAAAAAAAAGQDSEASAAASAAAAALAASASMSLSELAASVAQLAASRDLSPGEAELAASNLALAGATPPCHVWYGDPLLSSGEAQHSVESYDAMEAVLLEQQRADWSMFDYAGNVVRREVEGWKVRARWAWWCVWHRWQRAHCGWLEAACGCPSALPAVLPCSCPLRSQAVVSALPVKPQLQREPCPDLLLDRFTPTGEGIEARVYPSDLARERRLRAAAASAAAPAIGLLQMGLASPVLC